MKWGSSAILNYESDEEWKEEFSRILAVSRVSRRGDRALEVFRVDINCKGYMYGQIYTKNGRSHDILYKGRGGYIHEGGDLVLTGPRDEVITVNNPTLIVVNLLHVMENSREKRKMGNRSGYCFEPYNSSKKVWNKPLKWVFSSDDERVSATVHLAFFRDAYQATLKFKLLGSKNKQVYGSITARTSYFSDYPECRCTLFRKKQGEQSLLVEGGKQIKLSKRVIAVPCGFNLIVSAHLKSQEEDRKVDIPYPKEVQVHSAELIFPGKPFGKSRLNIDETIQVKVGWQLTW